MSERFNSTKDTMEHKAHVKNYIKRVTNDLTTRGRNHDNSKLHSPEKDILDEFVPKLNSTEFGSEEREQCLRFMKGMTENHYEFNDHHPEHFKNGIKDMNLIQLMEMMCDWLSACERRNEDIHNSIELCQEKYGYSDEIKCILTNTANYIKNDCR